MTCWLRITSFLLLTATATVVRPATVPDAATPDEAPFVAFRTAIEHGQRPDLAFEPVRAASAGTAWELRARIVAAEQAYRSGDRDTAERWLTTPLLPRPDFLGAYAEYLLGLLVREKDPIAAHQHFTTAYESAGDTLLRHRAGIWIAERLQDLGEPEAAARVLDSLALLPLSDALAADLTVRRALILEAIGNPTEARAELLRLYLKQPLLGYRPETEPLYRIVRGTLAEQIGALGAADRTARAEALLEARLIREAAVEAKAALARGGADRDHVHLLLARIEIARRSPRQAIGWLAKVGRGGPRSAEARLVHARAQRSLGKAKDYEREMLALTADSAAGPERVQALAELARYFEDREPIRARALWEDLDRSSSDATLADEARWRLGWGLYRAGEFAPAAAWFGRLVAGGASPAMVSRGLYWSGRAAERAGRSEDAAALYREVERAYPAGYYGIAGRARLRLLGFEPAGGPAPMSAAPDPLDRLSDTLANAIAPAREMLGLGLGEDALAEIQFQCRRFPEEAAPRLLLAEAYHQLGNYLESVRALRRAFPDLTRTGLPERYGRYLYPIAHWEPIAASARGAGIDPYLAAAVIYQESRFSVEARSAAGALGLMQLMPGTAREVARKLGEPVVPVARLFEPERNIRYGVHYLRRLIDASGGSEVLALAGYNAGFGRVRRWSAGLTEQDEFIETIPFSETRGYVMNILVAHQGYLRVYDPESARELR
jgi:soluble lytic murein transglycosylase